MDSFFAAANNLDNLLDELEENEGDEDTISPSTSNTVESRLRNEPRKVLQPTPPTVSAADDSHENGMSDECIIGQQDGHEHESTKVTPKMDQCLVEKPAATDIIAESPALISLDTPGSPGNEFVLIGSVPTAEDQPQNSDLLMDLFGAVPSSNYVPVIEHLAGPLSPLNPFKVDLDHGSSLSPDRPVSVMTDSVGDDVTDSNQTHAPSGDTHEIPAEVFTADTECPQINIASVGTEQKMIPKCNNEHSSSQNPFYDTALDGVGIQEGGRREQSRELGRDDKLGPANNPSKNAENNAISKEEIPPYVQVVSQTFVEPSVPEEGHLTFSGTDVGIGSQDEAVSEVSRDVGEAVGFPKEVPVSEEEFQHFWNEMPETRILRELDAHASAADESTRITPETLSASLDNAKPLENDISALPSADNDIVEEESGFQDAYSSKRLDESERIQVDEPSPSISNAQSAVVSSPVATPESASGEVSTGDDVDDIDIPDEMLITQREFERFLAEESGAAAVSSSESQIPMETDNVPQQNNDINCAPLVSRSFSAPAGNASAVLPGDSVPSMDVSVPVDSHPNTDRPDRLDVSGRHEEDDDNAPYPETPPPPYTEEMHETYEHTRHMSPQRGRRPSPDERLPSRVNGEQDGQMRMEAPAPPVPNGATEEDGFSFLPSAVLESITRPGETKPEWVPDHDAPQCSNCAVKFTFTKRRHHCRACGRVFCAACCSMKSQLKYLDFKEARVCSMCNLAIMQADALAEMAQRSSHAPPAGPIATAEPTLEPSENMETDVPNSTPPENAALEPSLTPSAPSVDMPADHEVAPATDGNEEPGSDAVTTPGPKSVRFSDGTRPKHPDEMPSTPPPPSRMNRIRRKHGHHVHDPGNPERRHLPPIIIAHGEGGSYAVEEAPDMNVVTGLLESGGPDPQSFVLNPNLITHVKIISYANRQCWCFWTEGMDGVGQCEVALLLEREGLGDRQLPRDAFVLFGCIFDRARKGKIFNTTDFMPMTMLGVEDGEEIFGNKENAGFLFVQVTSQLLDGLECLKRKNHILDHDRSERQGGNPLRSVLFSVLVQKTEAPWATLFPMRLMLRLGMETKQYPCPLYSTRKRESVYHRLGHTILAILCDFRNFKYRVVSVPGLRVLATSGGSVSIQIPCNRFSDTMKIMNSSNESVLAMGTGTFGPKFVPREDPGGPMAAPCDSHLVCVQDEMSSNYHTEVMCMKSAKTSSTGAAFVIFNGSLKSDGNQRAKCAIVEDGIMVQLLPEKMEELRASLRSMDDFSMQLAAAAPVTPTPEVEEPALTDLTFAAEPPIVEVRWVEDDTAFNMGMFSPIDGTAFEGVVGFNVQGRSEQKGRKHTLRWNQVFFLASASDPLDMSRLAEQVANGCFLALTPVLHELARHRQHKVSIRVTIHPENVGYVAGSRCRPLSQACMNALDENLIPTIHNAAASVPVEQEAVVIELLFSILLLRPGYRTA